MQNFRQLEGPNHPGVIRAHSAIGLMRKNQGDSRAAAAHLDTAVTRGRDVFGPRHIEMATFYNNFAGVYEAQERFEEADSLYRLALAVDEAKRGPSHPYVAGDLHAIGTVNQAWGRPKQALEALAREVRLRRPNGPSVDLAKALYAQGTTLTELDRYKRAEDRLLNAHSVHAQVEVPDSSLTADVHSALATLYTEWGRPDQTQRWRRRADSLTADPAPSTAH
jgi:tetratricopeptide (TPR) repeat protein